MPDVMPESDDLFHGLEDTDLEGFEDDLFQDLDSTDVSDSDDSNSGSKSQDEDTSSLEDALIEETFEGDLDEAFEELEDPFKHEEDIEDEELEDPFEEDETIDDDIEDFEDATFDDEALANEDLEALLGDPMPPSAPVIAALQAGSHVVDSPLRRSKASALSDIHAPTITERSNQFGNPKWAGIRGITGDDSREQELGSGKWSESARSADEIRRQMQSTPVRELELEEGRGQWGMLILFAAIVGSLFAWWKFADLSLDDASDSETNEQSDDEYRMNVAPTSSKTDQAETELPQTSRADPSSEVSVILNTSPHQGATVMIDSQRIDGVTPMRITIPSDSQMVELCISLSANGSNGLKQDLVDCNLISLEELAAEPEYLFEMKGIEKK